MPLAVNNLSGFGAVEEMKASLTYTPSNVLVNWTGTPSGVDKTLAEFRSLANPATVTELIIAAGISSVTFGAVFSALEGFIAVNGTLTSIDITNLPNLITISLTNQALTQTGVNNLLVALDASGVIEGICDITGGTNAAPNGVGATAKTSLEVKNWFILTN